MGELAVDSMSKRFGSTHVLDGVSFSIQEGELFFILGASGCGKSTLLRIIAGLEIPDSGRVVLNNVDVTHMPAHRRGIGMVFQQYALWPHMTVAQNVSFGLEVQGVSAGARAKRVDEALEIVRMAGFGGRYPHEISGGQQQRVALARALAIKPKVLLLDEPLSNLDARLRDDIRAELKSIHQQLNLTMVYVTHDQEDALTLASRIALLREGAVEQLGTPRDLYERPRTRYAAEFLGKANLLPCTVRTGESRSLLSVTVSGTTNKTFNCPGAAPTAGAAPLLCIRPEMITVKPQGEGDEDRVSLIASVTRTVYHGGWFDVECKLPSGETISVREPTSARQFVPSVGSSVVLEFDPTNTVVVS
jgi:ABC-type Fe3+/spermidine/putrescine transport system ATPase subunit